MIMRGESDRRAFAGEYVLGVLDEAETARAQALLAADRSFAWEVADWQQRLAPLDETAAPVMPSARTRREASWSIFRWTSTLCSGR